MSENKQPKTPTNLKPAESQAASIEQNYGLKAHDYVQVQCCSGKGCRKNDSERIINLFKVMLHAHGVDDMVDVVTLDALASVPRGPSCAFSLTISPTPT
ncbi:MAG: hypothetical protein IJ925_03810 [Muribaculaceae bacterium]|nr:hypothetical protein [Muribaculaceae bacterium]